MGPNRFSGNRDERSALAPRTRASVQPPPLMVLGGEIDLDTVDSRGRGNPIVIPSGYGLCFDPSGADLPRCSCFIGPIVTTTERANERRRKLPKFAANWFGDDYEARIARVDIPDGRWDSHGRVTDIIYYRPGRFADDWHHEFEKPVALFKQGRWWKLNLGDCKIDWRGIVTP